MLLKYLRLLAKTNNIKDFDKYKSKVELRRVLEENGVVVGRSDRFEYMSIDDLYVLAKEKKVKYYLKKNKKELAKAVGIDCKDVNFTNLKIMNRNPTGIILRDKVTGKVLRFESIGVASRKLGIGTGSLFYKLKNKKPLKINDGVFSVTASDENT